MKVFVTGGTGAIGRLLVPMLVQEGHEVTALVRSPEKGRVIEKAGAKPVNAGALDGKQLTDAVLKASPEAIIHQLTALAGFDGNFRKLDRAFVLTNRFRTEVTDTLLAAARKAGTRRFIAQSFCGWPFAQVGGPVKTEEDPLDPHPPASMSRTFAALQYLEETIKKSNDIEAFALRYGFFYGPGTGIEKGGDILELLHKRQFPLVGEASGVWSFIHVRDAAAATVAALTQGTPGIYNIVDDEPAPVSAWLPYLAEQAGAKPPRSIPVWLARIIIGGAGVSMMTKVRGGSNEKAKRELGWQPVYASWREGFTGGLD